MKLDFIQRVILHFFVYQLLYVVLRQQTTTPFEWTVEEGSFVFVLHISKFSGKTFFMEGMFAPVSHIQFKVHPDVREFADMTRIVLVVLPFASFLFLSDDLMCFFLLHFVDEIFVVLLGDLLFLTPLHLDSCF